MFAQPHVIVSVPRSNEAYVSHFVGCFLDVADLNNHTVIGQVATDHGPRHLSFDPTGPLAHTANYPAGTVTVLDTATNTVVGTTPTGEHPSHTETSADGSRVFVVSSGANTVSAAQARAPFMVLNTLTTETSMFRRSRAAMPGGRARRGARPAHHSHDQTNYLCTAADSPAGARAVIPAVTPRATPSWSAPQ